MAVSSIEENVEDIAKEWLKKFGVKYYTKTESVNTETVSYTHLDVYKRQKPPCGMENGLWVNPIFLVSGSRSNIGKSLT